MILQSMPSTLRAVAIASVLAWPGSASANDPAAAYPSKPVKIIVATAAGSSADVVTRLVAEQLSAPLGQAVVVDNRPGAGQTIGVKALASRSPTSSRSQPACLPRRWASSLPMRRPIRAN
jgi:tripartite-type tricarboxylate transporter receptor subunit TctC